MQVCEPNSFMYSVGRLSIQNTPSEGSEICRHLTAISNTARTPNILSLVNLLLPSGCTRIYCANDKLSVQFPLSLSLSRSLPICLSVLCAYLLSFPMSTNQLSNLDCCQCCLALLPPTRSGILSVFSAYWLTTTWFYRAAYSLNAKPSCL
jgi:hypothetical protein